MTALSGAAPAISSSKPGAREVDRQRAEHAREAESDRHVRLEAGILGAASVLECALEELLHRTYLTSPPVPIREPREEARHSRVVAGRLEGRQRAIDLVRDLVDAALGADEQANQRRGQPAGNRAAGVAGLLGRRNRRRIQILRADEVADLEVRLGVVDEQRRISRPQSHRAAEEVRGSVRVVAGESPAACPCQPLGRSPCQRRLGRAGGRELQPVGVRLLEMVPEDLVQLRRRPALVSTQSAQRSCRSARRPFGIDSYAASRTRM